MYMNSVVQFCKIHYLLFIKSILYIHIYGGTHFNCCFEIICNLRKFLSLDVNLCETSGKCPLVFSVNPVVLPFYLDSRIKNFRQSVHLSKSKTSQTPSPPPPPFTRFSSFYFSACCLII